MAREVYILACVIFVNRVGTMVLPFLSVYLVSKLGYSVSDAGLVLTSFGVGAILGTFLGGRLVDLLGALRVQVLSLVLGGVGFLVLSQLTEFRHILIAVSITSFFNEMIRPSNAAAFVLFSSEKNRTRAFAMNRLAINLGMAIGPALGGFLATSSYTFLFICDGATCLVAAGCTLVLFKHHLKAEKAAPKRQKAKKTLGYSATPFWIFLSIAFLISLMFFQLFGTYPLYMKTVYNLSEVQLGSLFTINGILIVLFEMILAKYAESRDQLKFIRLGVILIACAFAMLPFGQSYGMAVAMILVLTFGEILTLPLLGSIVSRVIDPKRLGKMMGYYTSVFGVSHIAAPFLGTQIYELFSPEHLWITIAALSAPVVVLSLVFGRLIKAKASA